jgi:hypothetical protein
MQLDVQKYEGNYILVLSRFKPTKEQESRGDLGKISLGFGLGKAKSILANIDQIKQFVLEYEGKEVIKPAKINTKNIDMAVFASMVAKEMLKQQK